MSQNSATFALKQTLISRFKHAATKSGYAIWLVCIAAACTPTLLAQKIAVPTHHYNNLRTGWNNQETTLNPTNVSSASFGVLYTVAADAQVDAQPLVVPNVLITAGNYQGQQHDVVYVASENNTVYAIDAESGTVLLNPNFGPPVPTPIGCPGNPVVGINSTPAIDLTTNTMYVMVYTNGTNGPTYTAHALDLGSLTDKVTPVVVTASHTLTDGSTYSFNATYERQRPALLVANGNVYAGFGSFCDKDTSISRGWLLGWQEGTLDPLTGNDLFDTQASSPNDYFLSSIWMSGWGPAADASGNIYVVTGNSDPSGTTYDGVTDIQESVIKVSPDLSTVLDLFTPYDWPTLDQKDMDFGSGGVMLLPPQPVAVATSQPMNLAVAAGKEGNMFLMNQENLGGYNPSVNNVLGTYAIGDCFCGSSYYVDPSDNFPRVVSSGAATVEVWKLTNSSTPTLTNVANSAALFAHNHGFFTTVSSNGISSPIIWALGRLTFNTPALGLYALNPESGATLQQLYSNLTFGNWNYNASANLIPVVANGEVFVVSGTGLTVFGLNGAVKVNATPIENQAKPQRSVK